MAKNNFKQKFNSMPIEQFTNAPIAEIYKTKRVSNVTIPCEFNISNSKEWVDTNQK